LTHKYLNLCSDVEAVKIGDHNVVEARGKFCTYLVLWKYYIFGAFSCRDCVGRQNHKPNVN